MTSDMHARKAKLKTHLVSAKATVKQHVTPRRVLLLAAAACSASLILLTLRTLHSAASHAARADSATPAAVQNDSDSDQQRDCVKQVPPAVAAALVHLATSNETPPLTQAEAAAAARVLAWRAPCNLLVFGLDAGTALWAALNNGGRTLFLDADADRVAAVRAAGPVGTDIEAHHVAYQDHATSLSLLTNNGSADELIALRDSPDCTGPAVSSPAKPLSPDHFERSPCRLAPRSLPAVLFDVDWDVIMVNDEASTMASAVYAAGVAARARRPEAGVTDVVVHGVDSPAEERFARAFLCEGYIKEEAGRTRHFAVPSHREKEDMPFCP